MDSLTGSSTCCSAQETRSARMSGASSGLDFCSCLLGSELEPHCLSSSTVCPEAPDTVSVLIELVIPFEVPAPDALRMALWTSAFSKAAVIASVFASWPTVRILNLSALLAHLVSIGTCEPSATLPGSRRTSRDRDSHVFWAEVRDAGK